MAEDAQPEDAGNDTPTRDDILTELAAMRASNEEPEEKAIPDDELEDSDDTDSDDEDEDEDEDSDEDEDDDEESEGDEDDEDDDDDDEEKEEEKEVSALAKIRKAEKSFQKRMRAQKEKLQADKEQWIERVQAAEDAAGRQATYKNLAHSNPVALFQEFGIDGPDAYQALGKYFYQYGKGLAPDAKPQDKQAAESIKRQREQVSALEQTQAKLAELERKLAEKDQASQYKQEIQAFKGKLEKRATSEKFPLTHRVLNGKGKARAQDRLIQIAAQMARKTGEEPSPSKVLKRFEKLERAELEARGIDYSSLTKKTNPEKTAEKKSVKSKSKTAHKGNQPQEEDAADDTEQLLRELEEARARGEVV